MTVVAHVTDLHLVEHDHHKRAGAAKSRLLYLNTGRKIDPRARFDRVCEALRRASRSDHVVVTGDLTEDGTDAQFELLAAALAEAKADPSRVTLVPGNHDLYADPFAFARALRGPLHAYAQTSTLGKPVELAGAVVVPISTAMAHRLWFSAGTLTFEMADALDGFARDPALRDRPMLVVQHHPPLGHGNAFWNWIDGTRAPERGARLLRAHAHMHVLHGHTHARNSYRVRREGPAQVHSGAAVLSSSEHVRFYDTAHGELRPLDAAISAPVAARLAIS
jgi:3',5'-cyclic AMP phosphodiesterase CpdA